MSLTTRTLALLLLLATVAAGLAFLYGRHEAARAVQAEQRLALAVQAQGQLTAALETEQRGIEALRGERRAQEAQLRTADRSGAQTRHEGEARAQAVLLAPAPEVQHGNTRDLVRWASTQAQDLNRRLEVPPLHQEIPR